MATKAAPVTPQVLSWALAEDGRPLIELAEALDVNEDTLQAWATGDTSPTVGQVSDLAKVLRRPRALFFLPRPPTGAGLPSTFRHPPGSDRDVSQEARKRVRRTRRVQQALAWALRDEPPVELPVAVLDEEPQRAAAVVRDWVGVPLEAQLRWRDDRTALNGWRQALDGVGVFVFASQIGRDDVRGFSMWDQHAPLIVFNVSGVSAAARTFTVFHELSHLVLRKDSACVEPRDGGLVGAEVERWCERFAADLLMPASDVRRFLWEKPVAQVSVDTVADLARRYRVSARAAAVRLVELGLATSLLYAEVNRRFMVAPPNEESERKPMSAPRALARTREYGPRALSTILEQLPQRDALSILRVTVEDVRQLSGTVRGVEGF